MLKQILVPGYFCVHAEDTYAFTSRGWHFVEALKEGILYPRWAYLNFWGYGSPAFILYPPLGYYFTAFFSMFTGSVITAMNLTKIFALFLSGTGMFFLVREFYSERIALLTASFSIIFPYTIFQFYLVGTFYSIVSIMWFAPIILFTYRYMRGKSYKNVIYAGLCYGGLILTHLINAYMFTFVLVAFIIYMSIIHKRLRDVMLIPLIMGLGFLISSAYTVPIIFEKQFLNLNEFIGEGSKIGFIYDFRNFFILPNMTGKFSSGHLWNAFYHMFVFYVSLFCILIALSFLQVYKAKKIVTIQHVNQVNKFFIGTALFTIFLLFGISAFVWEIIPFFKYIQFSHRWLTITTFAVVFLFAVIFWALRNVHTTKKERNVLIVILILIGVTSFSLDYEYIRFAPVFKEQELIPVKTPNWYRVDLPVFVNIESIDKGDSLREKVSIISGEGDIEITKWASAERIIKTTAYQPLTVRIRTFNFPGWKAYIDTKQRDIHSEKDTGAILIDVAEGKHTLVLRFEDTPVRYYSKIISLVSFSIVVFLLFFFKKNRNK
jgi:hypothetical protein